MTVQPSPALLKIWISSNLKHLREAAGHSRADVQKRTGLSRAQIGHFETTERLPSQPVLEVLLTYYGVPERLDEFARVLDAARKGKKWWEHLASAVPPWFDLYLGLESGAAEIATFETYLIPGLLQTRDYAEAVVRGDPDATEEDVQNRVEVRMSRQRILHGSTQLWELIDESALYRERGNREIMNAQIDHLLAMSQCPHIDIQVLPQDVGAHQAQQGGTFGVLRFPPDFRHPGVVYEDTLAGTRYIDDPNIVTIYDRAMARMQAIAASPDQSRLLLQRARTKESS